MHPQSQYCELNWLANWFQRIMLLKQCHVLEQQQLLSQLQKCEIVPGSEQYNDAITTLTSPKLFVVDRSPYSACFYTRENRGYSFMPMIQSTIEELKNNADIHVYTVCLKVSNHKTLWDRICDRLKREPSRLQFNESSREWMMHIYDEYEKFPHWDFVMTNDHGFDGSSLYDVLVHLSTLHSSDDSTSRCSSPEIPDQQPSSTTPLRARDE